jgi:hypothetical protein
MLFHNSNFGSKTKVFFKNLFHVVFDDASTPILIDKIRIDDTGRTRITATGATRITADSAH